MSPDYSLSVEKNGSSLLTNLRVRLTVKLNMRAIEMIVMQVPMQLGNLAVSRALSEILSWPYKLKLEITPFKQPCFDVRDFCALLVIIFLSYLTYESTINLNIIM